MIPLLVSCFLSAVLLGSMSVYRGMHTCSSLHVCIRGCLSCFSKSVGNRGGGLKPQIFREQKRLFFKNVNACRLIV